MKMAFCHGASTIILIFLCIGRAASFNTLGGFRHTDRVANSAMLALMQHDKPTADDLEQVAGHLAQLAAAKIDGEQMAVDKTAVDSIEKLVSALQTDVTTAATQAQATLDGLFNKVTQCEDPAKLQPSIKSLEDEQTLKSTTHATCKSNLQTLDGSLTSCKALVVSLTSARESACDLVGTGANAPTPDGNRVCASASSAETYKDWVVRLAGYFDTEKQDYIEKETKCQNLKDYVTGNTSDCSSVEGEVNNKKQQCAADATALNTAGCALADTQAGRCHTYNCCYSDSTQAYTVAKSGAEKEEIAFKAQWKALAHIVCLLKLIVLPDVTTAKINECSTKSVPTTAVELTYASLPNQLSCTLPTVYPCKTAWEQQHQIGATCVPCQGIADSSTCGSSGGSNSGGGSGSSGGQIPVVVAPAPSPPAQMGPDGLWPQMGPSFRKCERGGFIVADKAECQSKAIEAGVEYYQYVQNGSEGICNTSATCPLKDATTSWENKIFKKP